MCIEAMPEHLRNHPTAEGTNTDWDFWPMKYLNRGWFAYGPRDPHCWHKWRELPKVLFALKGKGPFRFENSNGTYQTFEETTKDCNKWGLYLSAIQYWTRWHFALMWPLHLSFHFYFKKKDVIKYPIRSGSGADKKVFFFRLGARRNADMFYDAPSAFIGFTFN